MKNGPKSSRPWEKSKIMFVTSQMTFIFIQYDRRQRKSIIRTFLENSKKVVLALGPTRSDRFLVFRRLI
jgi:hypothetical protein